MTANGTTLIIDITHDRVDECVDLLTVAFADDPVVRSMFAGEARFTELLRVLMHFACERRVAWDWPVKAKEIDGRIVGVACLTPPNDEPWPDTYREDHNVFMEQIGPRPSAFLDSYARAVSKHRPFRPHYYVGALGVHPKHQGEGHARALLETIVHMSDAHAESESVALDTENPKNVYLYEHFGFEVTGVEYLGDVRVYCMNRPNNNHGK